MFKKIMAGFGIGTIKVRTVILDEKIERGKEIKGEVYILGGELKQKISRIHIHIDSNFHKDDDNSTQFRDITASVVDFKIKGTGSIKPHEEKIIPFSFFLPYYVPITFEDQKVMIHTKININFMNPPIDSQDFKVTDPWLDEILNYLTGHGYAHSYKSGACRHRKRADDNPTLFLQTFNLINSQGKEIKFVGNERDINVYINEKDRIRHFSLYRNDDLSEQLKNLEPYIVKGNSVDSIDEVN